MKNRHLYIITLILLFPLAIFGQTVKQFNGIFEIISFKSVEDKFEIVGNFSDLNSDFLASGVMTKDQIVDADGNAYEIATILSLSGGRISALCSSLNGGGIYPTGGKGIIFRPTDKGYPLITNDTPSNVLSTVINTSTISINSDLPSFQSGETLPLVDFVIGDVVSFNSQLYQLSRAGWGLFAGSISNSSAPNISYVPLQPHGSVAYLSRLSTYYVSDGTSWNPISSVSELPSIPKFGDIFYETTDNKLFMMSSEGSNGSDAQWIDISGGGIPEGENFPDSPTPGDLFFNTDNNTLYLYNANFEWVEVSSNGSTPADIMNPDTSSASLKEGMLFYNTSTHQLYVYNGTDWLPVGNELGDGQIFVGDASNVATAVSLSGDATVSNTGSLTIKDLAVTNSKLDKTNIPLSGFGTPTANISLGNGTKNYKIINLLMPTDPQDAATKGYIDNLFANPSNSLSLLKDNFFIGNINGKAASVTKNSIPLSGFGNPLVDVSMGGKYLKNLPDISQTTTGLDDVAVNKRYVDSHVIYPINIGLDRAMILQGNQFSQAAAVEKYEVPFSDFGAAITDVSLGNFKLTNLASPTVDTDAANKKYIDDLMASPATSLALPSSNLFMGNASGKAEAVMPNTIPVSKFGPATADLIVGNGTTNFKITNVADPVAAQDAATKNYVDGQKSIIYAETFPSNPKPGEIFYSTLVNHLYLYDGTRWGLIDAYLTEGSMWVGNSYNQSMPTSKGGIPISGFGAAEADVDFGNQRIIGLHDPVMAQDAVTKKYVDDLTASSGSPALADGKIFVGDVAGDAAQVSLSGDATIDNTGKMTIADQAITEAKLDKVNIPLSGFGVPTADLSLGSFKITNLSDPTADHDASTKKYVDDLVDGVTSVFLLPKGNMLVGDDSGNAASTAKSAITLSGFKEAEANISMGSGSNNYKIINLADPTGDQDATTKKYVDSKTAGLTTGTTPPSSPNAGSTYYNTTEKVFYVYDGTQWVPVDNKLATGQLYVGDASNKASSTAQSALSLSGFGVPTADLSLGSFKITNLSDPTADQDAVTKKYVDDLTASSGTSALADGKIFVGNISSEATPVSLSGDATIDNTGKMTIADQAITEAKLDKANIPLSGFGVPAADISVGSFKITDLLDPTADQDATTKKYVDSKTAGLTTGTTPPSSPNAGSTYYNTTEKVFYVYDGTQWVPVDNKLATGQLYVGDASNKASSTAQSALSLSGFGVPTADLSLGSFKITNLSDPTADQDAATKKYVDDLTASSGTSALADGKIFVGNISSEATPVSLSGDATIDNTGKMTIADQAITEAKLDKVNIPLSGFGVPAADISVGSFKITDLLDPTADQDASTKKYVDNTIAASKDNLGNHTATQNLMVGSFAISNDGDPDDGLAFDSDGNATFGQDVTVNGNLYTPSDKNLKTKIETLTGVIEKIDQMRGVQFEYKDQKKYASGIKVGVIAQELQQIYPSMVIKGEDGYLKVDYTQLTAVLIQAVKEQQQQIENQQQEIEILKNRMNDLQKQMDKIISKIK